MASIRGQIASIQLKNFMSYDDITLSPGSHLNFIIGPNGTGKSTFVCAVVIGLGGKLKSLGRADQLSSFLKTGAKEGHIIVELCDPAEGNLRIKRVITSTNSSEFFINESRTTASKISEIREYYNIQLDNLCTFLPQEKVQDFSRLNPQELLCQTQNIAGDSSMAENYSQLKELRTAVIDKEKQIAVLEKKLEDNKQKNERIKNRVQTYIQSRTLRERLTQLKQKRAWVAFFEEATKYAAADRKCLVVKRTFTVKQKKYKKLSDIVDRLERELMDQDESCTAVKAELTKTNFEIENKIKHLRQNIDFMEDFNLIVEAGVEAEKKKEMEAKNHQEKLDKLNNDLSTFEAENGTLEQLKSKIKEIGAKIATTLAKETEVLNEKAKVEDEVAQIKYDLENMSVELRILDKRRDFRLEYLKRYEPDVYKSVEWLNENRQLFRGRIYNPMLLELDVTDVKYAKYVEARIPYRDLIAFTCTDVEDMNLLIQKLRIEFGYRVNAVCADVEDKENYQPEPMSDVMTSFGFYMYVKTLITGPDDIIRYLCKMYKIHKVPIGDESVEMNCDIIPDDILVFFSDKRMFSIKFSEYSGDKSITVRQINEPKFFTVPLGTFKMKQLNDKKKELEAQLQENEATLQLQTDSLNVVISEKEQLQQKKRALVTLANENERILCRIKLIQEKIKNISWKDSVTVFNEKVEEREKLRKKILMSAADVQNLYLKLAEQTHKSHLCEIERKVNREELYHYIERRDRAFEKVSAVQDRLNTLETSKIEMKEQKDCLESEARILTDGIGPTEIGFQKYELIFTTLRETLRELDEDIQHVQLTAELMCGGDIEMLHEYEEREKEISTLTAEIKIAKSKLQQTRENITSIRHNWLIPLCDLIARINSTFGEFFRNMNCTGIVSLCRGEDENNVEEYGISIKVQFRTEVPLQELGRHFQSGGERAITTAVYLLSLQKLMNAPFRFVDEINQGMDATNERRMIELMIKVTDTQNSSQYFFITPKLLPDITCSEKLVVHCVFNGQNALPSTAWNLDSFLARM